MANTNDPKTLTAPLAIIKIGGVAVGKLKTVRISENFTRLPVKGIGVLTASEVPVTAIDCTFTASSYFINLGLLGTIDNPFIRRGVGQSLQDFINTILLQDTGVDIYLYRKIASTVTNNIVTATDEQLIGVLRNAFLNSQNFDITENQISGSDLNGIYLEPILG
jgi:hypothetical protein